MVPYRTLNLREMNKSCSKLRLGEREQVRGTEFLKEREKQGEIKRERKKGTVQGWGQT